MTQHLMKWVDQTNRVNKTKSASCPGLETDGQSQNDNIKNMLKTSKIRAYSNIILNTQSRGSGTVGSINLV